MEPMEIINPTYEDILEVKNLGKEMQTNYSRFALINALRDGKITITPCDFRDLFQSMKVLKKESASKTIVIIGELNFDIIDQLYRIHYLVSNNGVVAKLSFESLVEDNSLVVEKDIYKYIISRIISENISPNVIAFIGAFHCSNFVEGLREAKRIKDDKTNEFIKIIYQISDIRDKGDYNFDNAQLLLLERSQGITLQDWMEKEPHSPDSWLSILFQIIYTLEAFAELNLKHNDLHTGNLFIDTISVDPRNFVYFINEKDYFLIPVKYLVKIYDFDLSTSVSPMFHNKKLDLFGYCQTYGICNGINIKFDLFTILSIIIRDMTNKKIIPRDTTEEVKFLMKIIDILIPDKELFKTTWGFPGRLCNLVDSVNEDGNPIKVCNGPYTPTPQQMLTPFQAMGSAIFYTYRGTLPDFDARYLPNVYENFYILPLVDRHNLERNLIRAVE